MTSHLTDLPLETIRLALNTGETGPLTFCHTHNIWSPTDCPACQTQWEYSPCGIPCAGCARCQCRAPYGDGCNHACEPPICHPEQDCLPLAAGEGHHV
jgi:hypothetical protein